MYNRILAAVRFFKTAMRRTDRVRRWRLSAFSKLQCPVRIVSAAGGCPLF
jgi:hypothetical protein